MPDFIRVRGARTHNLKNIDVDIPRDALVVLTGVSGSGKSSLAFDTLYAEGQRRYVQSLSAYARQFLDQMEKPEVDFIEGLSPAVAIEQRHSAPNPRSTIATVTEIYDYLRVLYAVAGQPHDPATGEMLKKSTVAEISEDILSLTEGTRMILLAPLVENSTQDLRGLFDKLKRQGFIRVRLDGQICELDEQLKPSKSKPHTLEAVIDRLVVRPDVRPRLVEGIESALKWNPREIRFLITQNGSDDIRTYTTAYANPRTGFVLDDLTPQHFSFNTRAGACPVCEGVGSLMSPDPDLMVPDKSKALADGAIKTWWSRIPKMKLVQEAALQGLIKHFGVDASAPFSALPDAFKQALFHGTGDVPVPTGWKAGTNKRSLEKPYEGLIAQAKRLYDGNPGEHLRAQLTRYMNPKMCPACQGRRLKPESLAVKLQSVRSALSIHDFCSLSTSDALDWMTALKLSEHQHAYCDELRNEITKRLRFLNEVGLGYLALNRESGTLSGGEAQRIRLATQIGAGLAGVLYVLDEPSIGLHPADNERLIGTLVRLRDLGNTVLVVEHDDAMMKAADHLIELGPRAGVHGGQITAQGTPLAVMEQEGSTTGSYLSGRAVIPIPKVRLLPTRDDDLLTNQLRAVTVHHATEHNLQGVTVSFPIGLFTCVTGPSGSGKSTLVDSILRRALARHFYGAKDEPGAHDRISGLDYLDKLVVIDQEPIGRSPRSNPATYTGVFTAIRDLFTDLPLARVRGYDAGRFSFNVPGGRCEKCEGGGTIKIDMHFLADVWVTCDQCKGQRYNIETLEVAYKGRNIAEVLDMTISDAARFFDKNPHIFPKLCALEECGLGYLKLGQSGTTLSGGEAQRVKLATELSKRGTGRTLYLLDEPTTGLHFADIEMLMQVLLRLREGGNTLIVIEHNLDVIKCADHVIDLGPGGGVHGGTIVASGTPEEVARATSSPTGRFLKQVLDSPHH
ncbi:MAG: excinuclease ABC subunit UvrA [Verrucomicrobiaceae bacterium]|nr:excinuclease ABC subunit UvrA [Verrucomicrobiaceae bacterium]